MSGMTHRNKHEDQEYSLADIDTLTPHPENPNVGDVGAIAEGIAENGFYGAVLVQKSTGYILAGEHRWRAAKEQQQQQVPVITVDVDDDRAMRILLSDNAAAQLAKPDDKKLADILERLSDSKRGLAGTLTNRNASNILAARKIPETKPKESPPPIDQAHFLLSLPLEALAEVQTALQGLSEQVEIRSSVN